MFQRDKIIVFGLIFLMFIVVNEADDEKARTIKVFDCDVGMGFTYNAICENSIYRPVQSHVFNRGTAKKVIINVVDWDTYLGATGSSNKVKCREFVQFVAFTDVKVFIVNFGGFKKRKQDFRPYVKQFLDMHTDEKNGVASDYIEIIDDEMDGENYPSIYSPFECSTNEDIRKELKKLKDGTVKTKEKVIAPKPIKEPKEKGKKKTEFIGIKYHDPITPETSFNHVWPLVYSEENGYEPTVEHFYNQLEINMKTGIYITDGDTYNDILHDQNRRLYFKEHAISLAPHGVRALLFGVFKFSVAEIKFVPQMLEAHWYNHEKEFGLSINDRVFVYGDGIYNTELQCPDGTIFNTIFFYNFQQFQSMYRTFRQPTKIRVFTPMHIISKSAKVTSWYVRTVNGIYDPLEVDRQFHFDDVLVDSGRQFLLILIIDDEICNDILNAQAYPEFYNIVRDMESDERKPVVTVMSCEYFENFDVRLVGDILGIHSRTKDPQNIMVTMGYGIFNREHKHGTIAFRHSKIVDALQNFYDKLPCNRFKRSMGVTSSSSLQ